MLVFIFAINALSEPKWLTFWIDTVPPPDSLDAYVAQARNACSNHTLSYVAMWGFVLVEPQMTHCKALHTKYQGKFRAVCAMRFGTAYATVLGTSGWKMPDEVEAFEAEICKSHPEALAIFEAATAMGVVKGGEDAAARAEGL